MHFSVSYNEVISLFHLTWRDIQYAVLKNILNVSCVISHALNEIDIVNADNELLLQLAIMDKDECYRSDITDILVALANSEYNLGDEHYNSKWVYILLKILYDNKNKYKDPLDIVEKIYDEFGCPKEISGIVRYMPSSKSKPNEKEYNDNLLYNNWVLYLKRYKKTYSK